MPHVTLNHEQPTIEHAIVAILDHVRETARYRTDELFQTFLIAENTDEGVHIISVDSGSYVDATCGQMWHGIASLAYELQADAAVLVARNESLRIDVHERGRPAGMCYRSKLDASAPTGWGPFEVSVSTLPFDFVPGGDLENGLATEIYQRHERGYRESRELVRSR